MTVAASKTTTEKSPYNHEKPVYSVLFGHSGLICTLHVLPAPYSAGIAPSRHFPKEFVDSIKKLRFSFTTKNERKTDVRTPDGRRGVKLCLCGTLVSVKT